MNDILLKNALLEDKRVNIYVNDGMISSITPSVPGEPLTVDATTEVVDCSTKAVLPSFINMHTHAAMSMMRGVGEDISFHEWLARIWRIESGLTPEYVYYATKLACLEMIKTGTATFNDQYWFMPQARLAAVEMGIRPVLSYVLCDRMDPEQSRIQIRECIRHYEDSLLWPEKTQFAISVHAVYSVCEDTIVWAARFASEHGLKLHIHLSETQKEVNDCKAAHNGMSPVEYLESLGFLSQDVIAAHALWLSEKDVEILGRHRVNCVHNINSNLKLTSGYRFKYNELRDAGANVCIGTDGCGSSNNLDMLEAMKTAAIVQKAWRGDPTAMPLDELFAAGTSNGAKALGINTGVVKVGNKADLMLVDIDNWHFVSNAPTLANFVYSAHSDCIDSLMCDGRWIMRNRIVKGEREILADARKVLAQFINNQ